MQITLKLDDFFLIVNKIVSWLRFFFFFHRDIFEKVFTIELYRGKN